MGKSSFLGKIQLIGRGMDMTNENSKQSMMSEEGSLHNTAADDRRRAQRREAHDRRDMIRFELEKEDRRSSKDRRSTVTNWGTDQPV